MPSPFDFLNMGVQGSPEQMGPDLNGALAQNALMPKPQQQHGEGGGFGWRNVLGLIGDAILSANGQQPLYLPQMMQQRQRKKMSAALQNYLGNSGAAIGDMVGAGLDLGDAVQLYKMSHPEAEKPPAFVQEYEYRQRLDPESRKAYDEYANLRKFNPYGAPITLGPNDTIETPGAPQSQGEMTATNPQTGEKVRYNPESGQWEQMGGPTGQPSANFP